MASSDEPPVLVFPPLPPFQTLVTLVKGLDFTYNFTRLREHT